MRNHWDKQSGSEQNQEHEKWSERIENYSKVQKWQRTVRQTTVVSVEQNSRVVGGVDPVMR